MIKFDMKDRKRKASMMQLLVNKRGKSQEFSDLQIKNFKLDLPKKE